METQTRTPPIPPTSTPERRYAMTAQAHAFQGAVEAWNLATRPAQRYVAFCAAEYVGIGQRRGDGFYTSANYSRHEFTSENAALVVSELMGGEWTKSDA